jgi:hypothetical protein
MTAHHNIPPSEQWYHAAQKWADLNAAADMLEEGKSAFLSQKMIRLGDVPVSRAELAVKASPEWADYIKKMVRAREQANFARIEAEFLKMRFTEWQAQDANQRQEMRMVRT